MSPPKHVKNDGDGGGEEEELPKSLVERVGATLHLLLVVVLLLGLIDIIAIASLTTAGEEIDRLAGSSEMDARAPE